MTDTSTAGVVRRVPVEFALSWAVVVVGQLGIWSARAMMKPEPERTFTFNFIESSVTFIGELALGAAVLLTLGFEIGRRLEVLQS